MPRIEDLATSGAALLHACYTSVEHFLVAKTSAGMHAGNLEGAEAELEALIARTYTPAPQTALALRDQLRHSQRILSTGCACVDDLIGGGMFEGSMLEVAGESSSGKTQLCHSAAASTALLQEGVIYVDTTNSFSAARLAQLVQAQGKPAEAVLPLVTVHCTHSIHDLAALLDALAQQLACAASAAGAAAAAATPAAGGGPSAAGPGGGAWPPGAAGGVQAGAGGHPRPSVLILDSLSAVVSPVLGMPRHTQGHALLACISHVLKHLARSHSMAVLVTNHVVAHTRLQLQMGPLGLPSGPRKAVLAKSSTQAVGAFTWFSIAAAGLEAHHGL